MSHWYDIHQRTQFGYRTIATDILPTPRLMQATYPPKDVEAYQEKAGSPEHPAIWRLRDDAYDPPGTVYTRVTAITKHHENQEDWS